MTVADNPLRCNNLRCRTLVAQQGKAVVTTCSHIFCIPCGNDLFQRGEICPACDQSLTEPSDIVESYLNPANDYKATVLAGLHPSTIMEIATRNVTARRSTSQQLMRTERLASSHIRPVKSRPSQYTYSRKTLTGCSAFQTMKYHNSEARNDKLQQKLHLMSSNLQTLEKREAALLSDIDYLRLQLKTSENERNRLQASSNQLKTMAVVQSAAIKTRMSDNRSSTSYDFVPPAPPIHTAPSHQAPAPFVPTPARSGVADTPRDMLSKYNLRRLNHSLRPAGPTGMSRIEMTHRGVVAEVQRPPLGPTHTNAPQLHGVQARPPSKLAQRYAVGPAEYGAPY